MSCNYTILPIAELNNINYGGGEDAVMETSSDTVRKNDQDGNPATHFIAKWEGVMPVCVYQIDPIGDEDVKTCYTASELKDFIKDDLNWTNP